MTGLECLKEEMRARGLQENQINAKVVPVLLDILTNSGTKYTELAMEETLAKDIVSEAERKRDRIQFEVDELKRCYEEERELCRILVKTKDEMMKEITDYVNAFNETLTKCGSPEAQGVLKAAQLFINNVTIDTKYDNTAYIIGLAQILSRGSFDGMEQFKSMNPRLFEKKMEEAEEKYENSKWRII